MDYCKKCGMDYCSCKPTKLTPTIIQVGEMLEKDWKAYKKKR